MNATTDASPQVSVVCAWYNRADSIRDTVDSLLAQDFHSFEVLIVNDGSPNPRVREILDSYDDPRLRVVHQENAGFVVAIRRAIELTTGPFIAIQGAGDVSLQKRLRRQWEVFQTSPDVGVVGCMVSQAEVDASGIGPEHLRPVRKVTPTLEDLLGVRNPFTHGEVMFRRSVYDAVGGYRPFFKYAQDRDLWLRMGAHCQFRVIDEHLYRRRLFVSDGIQTSIDKLLIQKRLSTLAIQCHHERTESGTDSIERFDYLAGLFRNPSPIFANAFARLAISEGVFGSRAQARRLLEIARTEGPTSQTSLARAIYWCSAAPVARTAMQRLLRKHINPTPLK